MPEQPYHDIRLEQVSIVGGTGMMVRNAAITAISTTITTAGGPPFTVQEGGRVDKE